MEDLTKMEEWMEMVFLSHKILCIEGASSKICLMVQEYINHKNKLK